MKTKSYCLLLIAAVLLANISQAQTDSVKNKIQVKAGLYFNSHLNYYGRTDSLQSNGVFPMMEFWMSKHLYLTAAPVFVSNSLQSFQYAGTVTTAGLFFDDNKKWRSNLYIVKPFYKNNSGLVQSALKAQAAGTITLKNQFINITGGGDIKFSDRIDYGATGAIDHIFRFKLTNRAILAIDPTATINAGTQQFTNTYYKKNSFLIFPGTDELVSEKVKEFNILSYEISMPVIFAKGKFQALLIPSWVMPQNLITVPGRSDLSERGQNLFYVTAGIKASF
jgi:hypothetical protein